MKILFLDVDGVLNRQGTPTRVQMDNGVFTGVDDSLVMKLRDWLAVKDVKIVLSSTWRTDIKAKELLKYKGLEWIGETPNLAPAYGRGMEIVQWLNNNLDVTHFAILDDIGTMTPLGRHLVQTSEKHGLQDKHLKKLDKLLGYDTPSTE